MNNWQEYKLADLGVLQRGRSRHRPRYAFHLYDGKYPFIQTGEIREASKYILKYEKTYNEEGLKQSQLWPKGTLCITIAANIAELGILTFDACFPDSVLGFIPDEKKVDLDFIYYTLVHFQKELKHIGEGSVQDNINLGTFQDVLFPAPSLQEQKSIASILSSLDDKIDLLHRQNKTLEALAETLFRQWFVDGDNEDVQIMKVSDIANHVKNNIVPGDKPDKLFFHYSLPAYDNGKKPAKESGFSILSNKYKVLPNSILVSKLNPRFPRIWAICDDVPENSVCSTEFQVFTPKEKSNYGFLLYLLKSNDAKIALEMAASGTSGSHQRVKPQDILNIEFLSPSKNKIFLFSETVKPFIEKINQNCEKIIILETLRDTLLPKLMNGEIGITL